MKTSYNIGAAISHLAPSGIKIEKKIIMKPSSSSKNMDRQSKLLSRIFGKLRGDHKAPEINKTCSAVSTTISHSTLESTGCGSANNMADEEIDPLPQYATTSGSAEDCQFAPNIDYRYSGQYLTPDQLPAFCDQLHNLVEVIRNIQSYAAVTGEYPAELERRLNQEAREVSALAAEARNARDVVARSRAQRRALRAQRKQLVAHLETLRESEMRELESTVRMSDRKLFKNWEQLKDSNDPDVFEPLLEEIRNKQSALECLIRLIQSRQATLSRSYRPATPDYETSQREVLPAENTLSSSRRRAESTSGPRRGTKRRRREARSVPLSGETSRHTPPQNTNPTEWRESGATLTALRLSSRASVRDILFFTQ